MKCGQRSSFHLQGEALGANVLFQHTLFLHCQSWKHQDGASFILGPWDREKPMSQPISDGHVARVKGTNKQEQHFFIPLTLWARLLLPCSFLLLTDTNIWPMGVAVSILSRTRHGGDRGWAAGCWLGLPSEGRHWYEDFEDYSDFFKKMHNMRVETYLSFGAKWGLQIALSSCSNKVRGRSVCMWFWWRGG